MDRFNIQFRILMIGIIASLSGACGGQLSRQDLLAGNFGVRDQYSLTINTTAAASSLEEDESVFVEARLTKNGRVVSDGDSGLLANMIWDLEIIDKDSEQAGPVISIGSDGLINKIAGGEVRITGKYNLDDDVITSNSVIFQVGEVAADTTPPELIGPADNTRATNLEAVFVWSARAKATEYTVEIALDPEFSQPVGDSPYTSESTSLLVQLPEPYSYYWRVRADVTEEGEYSEARKLNAFDDAVLVYCPPAISNCSEDTDGDDEQNTVGNKSAPFRTISRGIRIGAELGIQTFVANRGSGNTPYSESLNIAPGTDLRGGYDAATWEQGNTRTAVETALPQVINISGIKKTPTRISFFDITSVSEQQISYVVYGLDNDNSVILENNILRATQNTVNTATNIHNFESDIIIENNQIILGNSAGSYAYGIDNVDSSPVIRGNTLTGGEANNIYGIRNLNSSPEIRNNILIQDLGDFGGAAISSSGSGPLIIRNTIKHKVSSLGASPIIINNNIFGQVTLDGSGSDGSGLLVGNRIARANEASFGGAVEITGSAPVVAGNILIGGHGTSSSYAISMSSSGADPLVFQNILNSGVPGTTDRVVSVGTSSHPRVENNILLAGGTSGSRRGIYEGSGTSDPAGFQNNVLLDTGSGGTFFPYYDDSLADLQYICSDGKPANSFAGCSTGQDVATETGGNKLASTFGDLFEIAPPEIVYTGEGSGNFQYDGDETTLEVPDAGVCGKFVVGEFIEYGFGNTVHEITATDCAGAMTVTISPAIPKDLGDNIPVLLWGSVNANYSQKYSLKSGSSALGNGLDCPGDFTVKTHVWDSAADQADCDSQYPYADSVFSGGNCVTEYLYPALEILEDSDENNYPANNGNGLCESGETCLINNNSGFYSGHGNLTAAACDASGLLSNVTLMEYENNGY